MRRSAALLALLPLLPAASLAAEATAPIYLQALSATSGTGAEHVLDMTPGKGWTPAGDPRDEGILFRFEQPTPVDAIRLAPCAGGVVSIVLSVDGAEVSSAKLREGGAVLSLPGAGSAIRSVFVRISGGQGCLAGVSFARGGATLPVRPPRSVPGAVTASSTLAPVDAYLPSYLFDGRLDFGWVEGAKGTGAGESVTVTLQKATEVTALELWNGYQRSRDHFQKNARAKKVTVEADGKKVGTFPLRDAMGAQKLTLPAPVTAATWTLRIDEAVAGTRYPDLVLSELRFWDAAGPFTVTTSDAPQREAALRAQIAGGPLPKLLDRQWIQACFGGATRHLKLRGNHTFVWYELHEEAQTSASEEVFDGVYVPTQPGGPWARIELYGRRHRIERSWRPYEDEAEQKTDRIGGGNVALAQLADLGLEGWKALYAEWKSGPSAALVACVEDPAAAYEQLVKKNAVLVRGAAFQDLLVEAE